MSTGHAFALIGDPVQQLRVAITNGLPYALDDGQVLPHDTLSRVIAAKMLHELDVARWKRGGQQGPQPNIEDLLVALSPKEVAALSLDMFAGHFARTPVLLALRKMIGKVTASESMPASGAVMVPDLEPHVRYTARQLPGLRDELVQWLRRPVDGGARLYQAAIAAKRQFLFAEPRPGMDAGQALAHAEADTLVNGDLYFIDADMCQLLASAYPTMPGFAPASSDLPSQRGFAVFAAPVAWHRNNPLPTRAGLNPLDAALETFVQDAIHDEGVQILAISWRPFVDRAMTQVWKAGGVWATFWGVPASKKLTADGGPAEELFEYVSGWLPMLTPEHENAIGWYDPDLGMDESLFVLEDLPDGTCGTDGNLRALLAVFQLARQTNLAEVAVEKVPGRKLSKAKAKRQRARREQPATGVRVVRLREHLRVARDTGLPDGDEQSKRVYRHRWVVRGFWRKTYYPSTKTHRPQWIAPHVRGPKDAPLIVKRETVIQVSPPAPTLADTSG